MLHLQPTNLLARRFFERVSRDRVDESLDAWIDRENQAAAVVIALLAAAERDEVYRDHGHAGLTQYCMEKLGVKEHAASLRVRVARAAIMQPVIIDDLETRALYLSSVRKIAPYLTPGPAGLDLIAAARYKTGSQIEAMLDERFPDARSHRFDRFRIKELPDGRIKLEVTLSGAGADKLQLAREIATDHGDDNEAAAILEQALDEWIARRRPPSSVDGAPETNVATEPERGSEDVVFEAEDVVESNVEPRRPHTSQPAVRELIKHRLFTAVLLLGYPRIESEQRTRYALQRLGHTVSLGSLLAAALQPASALRTRHATLPLSTSGSQVKEEEVRDPGGRHPPGAQQTRLA